MSRYLHFTLGPVQSFVSQARRTKDFWAGSFLLSFLSGVAMAATEEAGGTILFPLPDKAYLNALRGEGNIRLRQGNVPNRFKAEVPDTFSPQVIVDTVNKVWRAIADTVWKNDLSAYEGTSTQTIWERQVGGFWEMTWAISDNPEVSNLLDRRKNWRTHLPAPEPGQKCAIMAGYQELSGEEMAQSKEQRAFWKKLRASKGNFDLDLAENERLCALAFIKRRFVRYFDQLHVDLGDWAIKGWELSPNVPSVALLAAAPWLASVAKHPQIDDLIEAAKKLDAACMPLSELKMLRESGNRDILKLDGTVLFDTLLENRNIFPSKERAEIAKKALRPLYKENVPSPFYAILMMDGDHLGVQMSDPKKQQPISEALQRFTGEVDEVVDAFSGFLVYAGGDDVLAILPLEDALDCALELRKRYDDAFVNSGVETSISAAVIFSHIKNPLHGVLHHIHELLDNVAKERTGRDAIAIETLKPGGVQQIWSKKWDDAIGAEGRLAIAKLCEAYRDQTESGQFSSGFFYRIREIMQIVEGVGSRQQQEALLAVEYRAGTNIKQEEALKMIEPLLRQCTDEQGHIGADAALIVRFLAQKGVER